MAVWFDRRLGAEQTIFLARHELASQEALDAVVHAIRGIGASLPKLQLATYGPGVHAPQRSSLLSAVAMVLVGADDGSIDAESRILAGIAEANAVPVAFVGVSPELNRPRVLTFGDDFTPAHVDDTMPKYLRRWLNQVLKTLEERPASPDADGLLVAEIQAVEVFLLALQRHLDAGSIKANKEALTELDLLAATLGLQLRLPTPRRSVIKPTLLVVGNILVTIGAGYLTNQIPSL